MIMPAAIDNPFISHVEQKHEGLKFLRIDTDLNASFKEEVKEDDEAFKKTSEELTEVFKKALNNDKLDIKVEKMKNGSGFHDYHIRGHKTYAGYDEDVQHGRYGYECFRRNRRDSCIKC